MREILLGIDIGTTSVKAIVIDAEAGRTLARATKAYESTRPVEGWFEQNPYAWAEAIARVWSQISDVLVDARLLGVGVCSQVNTHVLVDSNLTPLTPAIVWKDVRCADIALEINSSLGLDGRLALWGEPFTVDASFAITRIEWWRRHEPELLQRAHRLLLPKDFAVSVLCGGDTSDSLSAIGLVDAYGVYRPGVLDLSADAARLMPPLKGFDEVAGTTTGALGLPRGIPVSVGTMDAWANVYGSGLLDGSHAMEIAGTSEILGILCETSRPTRGIVTFPRVRGRVLHAAPTQAGGDALNWFAEMVEMPIDLVIDAAQAAVGTGSRLVFMPHLDGERAPIWNPDAQGVWLGVSRSSSLGDMALSVLEGVAFSARQALEGCEAAAGGVVGTVRISGGGARSELWNQVKSNVLGRPVAVLSELDTGARGAALIAGRAVELTDDLELWAAELASYATVIEPDEEAVMRYDALYGAYRQAYVALEPTFSAMSEIRRG